MGETTSSGQKVGPEVPGWTRRPRPEPVTLSGSYVEVRPLSSAQYADLYAATCGPQDDDLWTYRPVRRPTSLSSLWMHLAGHLEADDLVSFALVPLEGERAGKASGIASYTRIAEEHGQVEVAGVLFGRALQRSRAATEGLHLLMAHAFETLGYRRFEWKCDSLNEASRRAALRLGFVAEGRFRQHMVTQGRSRDTDWFSVTDGEWPAVRRAHEQWLDPTNFTDEGTQILALSSLTSPDRLA